MAYNTTIIHIVYYLPTMIAPIVILTLALGARAQICCVPPQWEGSEGTVIAVSRDNTDDPMIVKGGISVAYDATNKRVAAYMTYIVGDYNTTVGVILNYAQGVQYTVSGNNCTRTPLKPFVPNCIPSNAKLLRSSYLGAPNNKLVINTYSYMVDKLEIEATVTADACVPVGEYVYGTTGGEFVVQSVGFSGISAGISMTNAFTPPSSCRNSPLVQVNLNPMQSRLLRRYSALFP